jgi:hypothetical protein
VKKRERVEFRAELRRCVSGMNYQAQRLHLHELQAIVADPKAKARVLKSYRLMLDFYGALHTLHPVCLC